MNRVVWKFVVPPPDAAGRAEIEHVPIGAELLGVAFQDESVVLWARCEPNAKRRSRAVLVINTGMIVSSDVRFIGTAIHPTVGTVWHVFEPEPPHYHDLNPL